MYVRTKYTVTVQKEKVVHSVRLNFLAYLDEAVALKASKAQMLMDY